MNRKISSFSLLLSLLGFVFLVSVAHGLRERGALHQSLAPGSLRSGQLGQDWHHVPRHKPGYLPKFGGRNQYRQLNDALQNETAMSDPFQGNYQLNKAKNFVAVNKIEVCSEGGMSCHYPVEVIVTEYRPLDGNNEFRYEVLANEVLAVASPDFGGELYPSLVVFYDSDLDIACQRNAFVIFDTRHGEFAADQAPAQVKGCLGGVENEVVRGAAWGNTNPTAAYDLPKEELLVVTFVASGTFQGRMVYKLFSRNPTNNLLKLESTLTVDDVHVFHPTNKQGDVVVGDFDGDGLEEFACLYFTADNEAKVDIITVDENMKLTVTTSTTLAGRPYGQMAAGHLFSPDWEELALLCTGVGIDNSLYVHHLKLNSDGELEAGVTPLKLENLEIADTMSLDIVAGDLDGDTRDEVGIAFTYPYAFNDNVFHWRVYLWAAVVEPNGIKNLTEPHDITTWVIDVGMEAIGCSLAIGRFSQQQTDEQDHIFLEQIAVMGTTTIQLFRLTEESLTQMSTHAHPIRRMIGGQEDSDTKAYNKEFLTAVPYATENVRLGKPRHWRYPKVLNIVASLRTPPRHFDIVDGVAYTVNVNPANNVGYIAVKTSFESSASSSSRFSVEFKKTWAVGSKMNLYLGPVTLGMEATYGKNFENVNSEQSVEVWRELTEAVEDDALIRTEVVYDVWEYPVYSFNFTETEPTDYIVVIWPERLPDGSEEQRLHSLGFKSPDSFVRPFNEVNNLFSYYEGPPPNLGRLLKIPAAKSFGGTTSLFEVTWEEIQEQSELTQTSFGVGASFGLDVVAETEAGFKLFGTGATTKSKWGFGLEVTGEYKTEDIQVSSMSISESTRIAIKLDNASPEGGLYPYTIYPYIFYDIDHGYLCVDYRVLIPTGASQGTISFWEEVYDKPDLTWNLPYRWDMLNGRPSNNKYFTKSLLASNENPEAGENLAVVFHARDYSLIPANNVVLRFFQGDFRNPANQFGEDLLLEEVWRNGFEGSINDTWREIQEPLDRCLYAWLDPDDEILEVHENDNVGYIVLNSGSFSQNELVYCGDIIKDTFGFEVPPDTTSSAAPHLLPSFFV